MTQVRMYEPGKDVRLEQDEREVHLVLVCGTMKIANLVYQDLKNQLDSGFLVLTLAGNPKETPDS